MYELHQLFDFFLLLFLLRPVVIEHVISINMLRPLLIKLLDNAANLKSDLEILLFCFGCKAPARFLEIPHLLVDERVLMTDVALELFNDLVALIVALFLTYIQITM